VTSARPPYLTRRSRSYPPLLAAIHDPPVRLYLRGEGSVEMLSRPAVAVVGTRSCSPYGVQVARRLGRELAAAGVTVVSGLARGIDGEAHRGALQAGGPTVAVLGCGIDRDYPRAHIALARRIAEVGLLVSEYEPGVEPAPWRFPARNRIIAGLTAATVIVEARGRSGALITADFALEDGREVFAVPGEITSALSRGTNELLRLGAAPLLEPCDVLAALGLEEAPARSVARLSELAKNVRELLADHSASIDELIERSGLAADAVAAALVELELAGEAVCAEGVYRAHERS
jgi:DNA processing protein